MTSAETPFITAARAYCAWVESEPSAPETEARLALRLLSGLHFEALMLAPGDSGKDVQAQRLTHEEWTKKHQRFASMPFQYYREFLLPSTINDEEAVVGDVADDLADIYRDVAAALSLYDDGHVVEALWEFRESFRSHWGQHAVGAINAIHKYVADQYADF